MKEISITIQTKDGIRTNIYEEIIDKTGFPTSGKLIKEGELIPHQTKEDISAQLDAIEKENITLKERLTIIEKELRL